jgi:hypothetical protein
MMGIKLEKALYLKYSTFRFEVRDEEQCAKDRHQEVP